MAELTSDFTGMSTSAEPSVPCLLCALPIPAASFLPWSREDRMLCADCPHCARRVMLPSAFWEHFSGLPVE